MPNKNYSSLRKTTRQPAIDRAMQVALADSAFLADAGKTEVNGFLNFIREQGIIGLAVGLAIGAAAGATVKQIVDGLINPIVGFIIGGVDLSELVWVLVSKNPDGTGGLVFGWGAILSSVITLLATALVIYLLIHFAKLDRIDKKKENNIH